MLEQNFPFQVAEPLRAMVMGAPLEDARHLAQRYDRVRQEAEAQVILLQTSGLCFYWIFSVESERTYHQKVLQILEQLEAELNLSVGDYVVVRKIYLFVYSQLSNNGWAEGECKGKAGWFPSAYIERQERVLASKIIQIL
ncbi:hypothetical protein B296_00049141 [Ensete ventricosum]|uniref:SH3 domain-containing protein n=1 Tax=Ensete ventricosum TaxID=4639 RepID=A0A426XSD0_ENSVE|nr:hypothetical protein B296_00049141 [Ensete ventricosum]